MMHFSNLCTTLSSLRSASLIDLDNLIKSINDALLKDDSVVHRFEASKWWGDEGKIIIQNF